MKLNYMLSTEASNPFASTDSFISANAVLAPNAFSEHYPPLNTT